MLPFTCTFNVCENTEYTTEAIYDDDDHDDDDDDGGMLRTRTDYGHPDFQFICLTLTYCMRFLRLKYSVCLNLHHLATQSRPIPFRQ